MSEPIEYTIEETKKMISNYLDNHKGETFCIKLQRSGKPNFRVHIHTTKDKEKYPD
jgi:hypothetical protein